MKLMKKTTPNGSVTTMIVILVLALGIGGSVFGLLSVADLLRVSAEQTAKTSPSDTAVSPVDLDGTVSRTDENQEQIITRSNVELIPFADPAPTEIPLYVTHDMVMNDGRTVTTAYPAGYYDGVTGTALSVLSGETKNEVSFDRSVPSSQPGALLYGHDLQIKLSGLSANYSNQWGYSFHGSVKANLSDGSSIDWPLGTAWESSYFGSTSYEGTFYWSKLSEHLGEGVVTSVTVNQINSFRVPGSITFTRHSDAIIKVESLNPQSAWDSFFPTRLSELGNSSHAEPDKAKIGVTSAQFAEGDHSSTFATYFLKGGRFTVKSLTDVYKQRFSNAACTSYLSNGTKYTATASEGGGKSVSFVNYHRNQNLDYYLSLVCYDRKPDYYLGTDDDNAQVTEISELKFIRDDTSEDVTASIEHRLAYKSGSPYVQFKQPAYDVTVKIKQKIKSDMHTVTIVENRLTTKDTIWVSRLNSASNSKDSPIYTTGDTISSYSYTCNSTPYNYPSNETTQTTVMGLFREDAPYKYYLTDGNGTRWDNSTMVQSVKIYNADSNAEVNIGLSYAGSQNKNYYSNVGRSENAYVFDGAEFTMPDCNLKIVVTFGKTIGACRVKQQIVTSDGSSTPADNTFQVTFGGTARDAETTPFIFGTTANNQTPVDSFTAAGAANGFGLYRGTKNIHLTPLPAEGYAVSYINVIPTSYTEKDYGSQLVRDGDTFTIPDSILSNETSSGYYGLMYEITVSYTKVAKVRLEQRADGIPTPDSSTVVGTVTLSSQNGGTFVDPNSTSSNNLSTTYQNKLLEGSDIDGKLAKSSLVYASAGNKLTVKVNVNTGGSRAMSST